MSKYAIEVKNVKKSFYLPHHKNDSLKSTITQMFKSKEKGGNTFNALKDISFNIEKGDFFGILGRNGSGKSTLLKIISEIYKPTKGSVKHDGKLVSFIELGVGFKSELTGRENVFLNGALLGFSKDEIAAMYDDIVAFAEIEEFMDQKLKNYSSGMKVRLAFSVAIRAKADILILDEVLAVGDAAFQKKCNDYFRTLKNDGKTVVLVTHSMGAVREFCNRAIVIDDGKVAFEGGPDEAADRYMELFTESKKTSKEAWLTEIKEPNLSIENMSVVQYEKSVERVKFREEFTIKMHLNAAKSYHNIVMGVFIYDQAGRSVIVISSKALGGVDIKEGVNDIFIDIQNILTDGSYYIDFAIEDKDTNKLLIQKHNILPFTVVGLESTNYSRHSLVYPDVRIRYGKH